MTRTPHRTRRARPPHPRGRATPPSCRKGRKARPDTAAILSAAGAAAYDWDIASDALHWAGDAPALLGLRDPQAIATGHAFAALLDPANVETRAAAVLAAQEADPGDGVPYLVSYCLSAAPRAPRLWLEDSGRWHAGPDGRPARARGVIRIVSAPAERRPPFGESDPAGAFDCRGHVAARLQAALQEALQLRGSCGFMLVSIDGLHRINESYGYDIADAAINAVAERLRARMRGEDSLGRFAGNKLGIVLKACTADDIGHAAERFLAAVRDDMVMTAAGPVPVTITIGGVIAPRHAGSVQDIFARAQEALDRAKARRPGSYFIYQPNLERDAVRRENLRVADRIVTALNERRILLAFEPVVEIRSRRPAFYECLMRIRRADGSIVPAASIIPVAERIGLVRLLDQRVLELAVAELAACPALSLSLNVSPASTTDADWRARLGALMSAHPDVAGRLIVEITESAAIHDLDDTRGFVARVKDLGGRIAIDDFGAGYTSFRNLRRLGVDIIKIDGEFARNLQKSEDDRTFVRTLLDLGSGLHLKTVVEWVQDEASAAMLADWGCDYLQGEVAGRASMERPWRDAGNAVAASRAAQGAAG